jgi:hypothetical protein
MPQLDLSRCGRLVALALMCGHAPLAIAGDEKFSLSDLSNEQRGMLFTQIDAYGLATAYLNACQRPTNLVARLAPIARGCIEEPDIVTVVKMYKQALARHTAKYNCAAPGAPEMIAKIEQKIAMIVSGLDQACHSRSFYRLMLVPKM